MSALVCGTLSVLAAWMMVSVAFIGLGLGVKRALGSVGMDVNQCFTSFWMGFSVAILLLQVWHFAFPVSWISLAVIVVLGLLGLLWNFAEVWKWVSRTAPGTCVPLLGILVVGALWVANGATAAGNDWDYGVYHLPAVRWTEAYPIVAGLGNLHGRLAFNSSYYLYAAMLDVGPWSGQSNHLANGLLATALLFQIVVAAFRLANRQEREHQCGLELGLLAPVLFIVLRRGTFASVMPDVPVAIVLFVAATKLFDLVAGMVRDPPDESYDFVTLMTLLAAAICLKLTAVGFSLPAGLVALTVWVNRNRRRRQPVARTLSILCVLAFALGGSWLVRGVILSGYPAYPSRTLAMPVDWKVPAEQARTEIAWTRHYGRWYYNPLMQTRGWVNTPSGEWVYDPDSFDTGWRWLPGWISNLWREPEHREGFVLPVVLMTLAGFALLVRSRIARATGFRDRGWLVLPPALTALIWWFLTAPTPRYGFFLCWILAAVAIAQTLRAWSATLARPIGAIALAVTLAIGILPVVVRVLGAALTRDGISLSAGFRALVVIPDDHQWFQASPHAALKTFTTDSGLTLHVPVTDQRCWDAPLPCTPQPAVNLALRHGDDLRFGFVNTDGQWRQQNFPDPRSYRSRESPR